MNAVVLGGTHDHIKLINILKEIDYTVYLIDYYDNPIAKKYADYHIKGSTLDKEFVLRKCKELRAELCVAFCIDQALLTMAYVCEKLHLPCHISYQTALELTNKVLMKRMFKEHIIPTSNYIEISRLDGIEESVKSLSFPLVVKPADANSSKGVRRVNDFSQLADVVKAAFEISNSKQVVIEEFKTGIELSVDVVITDGECEFILITENIKRADTPDNFTIVRSVFKKEVHERYYKSIATIASNIAKVYKLKNTPMLIQLLANGDELNVIEFSARIGGGSKHYFIEKVAGFNMLQCFLDIVLQKGIKINSHISCSHASVNYVYVNEGIISSYVGVDKLKEERIIEDVFEYKTIGSPVVSASASTDRPLGFMVVADSKYSHYKKTKYADETIKILDAVGNDIMIHNLYD